MKESVKFIIPQGRFFDLASASLDRDKGVIVKVERGDLDSIIRDQSNITMRKIECERNCQLTSEKEI
ncbi:MAG: hypothetical protein QXF61_09360 [Nitrososphaeria archaeon]